MPSTITAMFDTRADADAAKARLQAAEVDAGHVNIHDQTSAGYKEQGYSTHQDHGMWASVKHAFLPDEDRHAYEEGVRRGGAVLTADVQDDHVDRAMKALEGAGSVDVDERADQWRESGWDYPAGVGAGASAHDDGAVSGRTAGAQDDVIPIVEEKLVVGKRDVSRGGVHVRSYVTETPVHEQVRLREERINVERRRVDREVSGADDAFRERAIDVSATGEEAVIGKTARVVEELVVSKTADSRVEEIDDTVRRTQVEIERDEGEAGRTRTGSTPGADRR